MVFQVTPNVYVERDSAGNVRQLRHLQQPYVASGIAANARALASAYLQDAAPAYGIASGQLQGLSQPVGQTLTSEDTAIHFADQSSLLETTLVSYAQTHWGLPIWEAGISVCIQASPDRVTSSRSTLHIAPRFQRPSNNPKYLADKIDEEILKRLLGVREGMLRINGKRLRIYQYDPATRFDPESSTHVPTPETGIAERRSILDAGPPTLPLADVPASITAGTHYVVSEVLFTHSEGGARGLNWRVFIDVDSGAALYLRAFVAGAFANVFLTDPITATGDTTKTACAGDAALDLLTSIVTLPRITSANPQALVGQFVQLEDVDPPTIAPPIVASPPGDFTATATSNTFAATNAYYHVDLMYGLMQDMGFDVPSYHSGTSLPVPADQADYGYGTVNAYCAGNTTGTGTGHFGFGLVDNSCGAAVGMAADARIVMHEFCHNLLWNRVHSPNFGFAHSAGDSFAAILNDPNSNAPDRFQTFPWVPIVADRRHDRDVTAGWAWGGPGAQDDKGYGSEQILSTTHFRVYRSMGGDDGDPNVKQAAAQRIVYLIIRAIASLGPSPITTTPTADPWATALMNADIGTTVFASVPGGTAHKVVRWSFEKQGLYQPSGAPAPVMQAGAPPDVDVYIDDGRGGEYPYQPVFWENTEIWNRLNPDGGLTHETPIVNQTNYGYVRIRNRGTQQANNAVVSGYHCRPSAGLTWPDDWQPMTTTSINVPGSIAPGGAVVVGPFEWTPSEVGHECMLMSVSADGDLSNVDPAGALPCAAGPTPDEQLARFDNNIGQRNVAPVPGGGGLAALVAAFANRHFWVNNPYSQPARITLTAQLPDFLRQRGWQLSFTSPGSAAFTLQPRANREITLSLKPGADFTPSDVIAAGKNASIVISARVDGNIIGGMTYTLDPTLKTPPIERCSHHPRPHCKETAAELLECIKEPYGGIECVRVKRITLDIYFKEPCCDAPTSDHRPSDH